MEIKASFSNVANVLLDWDDAHDQDFCSWRGVFCDNVTFSVASLNLLSLNLGGEISPAIGDLGNLQSINRKNQKQNQPKHQYKSSHILLLLTRIFIATNRDAVTHLTDAQEWAGFVQ